MLQIAQCFWMLTEVLSQLPWSTACNGLWLHQQSGWDPQTEGSLGLCVVPCSCLTSRKKQEWTADICTKNRQNVGRDRLKGAWRAGQGGKQQEDKGKHKGSGVDEEMSSPSSTLSISRMGQRSLESSWTNSPPWGELGKMRLGKSRCLSNLFKFSRLEVGTLFLNHGWLGFDAAKRVLSLSHLPGSSKQIRPQQA